MLEFIFASVFALLRQHALVMEARKQGSLDQDELKQALKRRIQFAAIAEVCMLCGGILYSVVSAPC